MSYEVRTTPQFDREAKRLAKKWSSLKSDLIVLFAELAEEPIKGTAIGGDIYKVRLRITSTGKGRSGGARVITLFRRKADTVYALTIYAKSEKSTVSDSELKQLLRELD